jgi:GNAT superfamily N-acetyltransferase
VHPDYRRQGLAKRLLQPLVTAARQEKRRLLAAGTNDRVPAGAAFMQRLGARAGLVSHTNQLVLAELNHDLLRRWLERGQQQADDFALGLWEGPFPEAELDAIVQLHHVMNTAPRDDLEMEDFHITAQQLREWEQNDVATRTERWVIYVREKATDQLAGFTAVYWSPNRSHLLFQGDTGVFPQYRNRGLGRWLKAVMLEKVLRERPEVKFVRTGNADSNAAMLKINHELGFKPLIAECYWQVEREKVEAYLAANPVS